MWIEARKFLRRQREHERHKKFLQEIFTGVKKACVAEIKQNCGMQLHGK